jgi:hypothetical protein
VVGNYLWSVTPTIRVMMLDNTIASCHKECDAGIRVWPAVEAEKVVGIKS